MCRFMLITKLNKMNTRNKSRMMMDEEAEYSDYDYDAEDENDNF